MKSRVQHYAQAHSDLLLSSGPASPSPSGVVATAKLDATSAADPVIFRCPICDTFFSQRNSLKRHYARAHPGQEPPNAFRSVTFYELLLLALYIFHVHFTGATSAGRPSRRTASNSRTPRAPTSRRTFR